MTDEIPTRQIREARSRGNSMFGQSASTGTGGGDRVIDPTISLLLHMDGVNTGTTFIDQVGNTVTPTSTTTSSTQVKFGNASGFFSGSPSVLQVPNTATLEFGTGDFTIDLWIYWAGTAPPYQNFVSPALGAFAGAAWYFRVNGTGGGSSGKITFGYPGSDPLTVSTGTITANTWTHVAVVRSGTTVTQYINGTADGSASSAASIDLGGAALDIGYSRWDTTDGYFAGYMDELRIIKGRAAWTANFTPPTAAYNYGVV